LPATLITDRWSRSPFSTRTGDGHVRVGRHRAEAHPVTLAIRIADGRGAARAASGDVSQGRRPTSARFASRAAFRLQFQGRVPPNLLSVRLLLYKDRHGPGAYGPAVWVINQKPTEERGRIEARESSRAFFLLTPCQQWLFRRT
jgi:hypothetical protein